ncbi:MAG: GNAT family N-acetyltransferase [Cypionkella sp.]
MSLVRAERAGDETAIGAVTEAAFAGRPYSAGREPAIVTALRSAGDLALSLVAEVRGEIVGHIAFSPVSISDASPGWYGLGPVSVVPERQRCGIGARLIETGLGKLRARGARGVVVLGNPAYYRRFGFVHDPELAYPGPPAAYFQRLILAGAAPRGTVRYAPAFG